MAQAKGGTASARRKHEALAWVLVVAWAIVIFAMSAKPAHDFEAGIGIVAMVKAWLTDVLSSVAGHRVDASPVGHFTEYLVLAGLLVNALRFRVPAGEIIGTVVAVVAVYSLTDEFHQLFVPGRAFDFSDCIVDTSAAAIAAFAGWLVLRKRKPRDG